MEGRENRSRVPCNFRAACAACSSLVDASELYTEREKHRRKKKDESRQDVHVPVELSRLVRRGRGVKLGEWDFVVGGETGWNWSLAGGRGNLILVGRIGD